MALGYRQKPPESVHSGQALRGSTLCLPGLEGGGGIGDGEGLPIVGLDEGDGDGLGDGDTTGVRGMLHCPKGSIRGTSCVPLGQVYCCAL